MADTYPEQIGALLEGDFKRFTHLIDYERLEYITTIHEAWMHTGGNPKSIFSSLPESLWCASSHEGRNHPECIYYEELFDSSIKLSVAVQENNFDRKNLQEFARRQRLARAHPFTGPEET